MSRFRVFASNRLEILFEYLSEVLAQPLASPLDREHIVVQSKGMERWLSIRLAQKFGVWGNCHYPFPNAIMYELIKVISPAAGDGSPFDPKILSWRIMKHLSECALRPGFESLRNYLGPEPDDLKRFQLAVRLANVFDRYTMFRPEWVLAWEQGKESHWQAQLWRKLQTTTGSHKAAILKKFLDRVDKAPVDQEKLPSRLSIFGIPVLPPMHLNIFAAMSQHMEVNLFLMNPCREYWFDLASEKQTAKKINRLTGGAKLPLPEDLHLERGHPLLASLGKMAAAFFDALLDLPFIEEEKCFEDPGQNTLLTCLQSDLLNLRDRGTGDREKKSIAVDDDSVRVQVCHSPMREMEVLYDYLLDLFERKPDLEPSDILVMTPDIESYAPYIAAVFEDSPKIPYSIADRSVRREGQVIEAFLKILGLHGSRFGQTQVLDILETPPIQRRFALEGDASQCVRRWVEDTRIRWGIDAEDRSRQGVPAFGENTWKAGLDRLLLGYALPGRDERMFAGILPYDHIEGSEAAVLGRFIDFIHQLFDQVAELGTARTLTEWAVVLQGILDRFFDGSEEEPQVEVVQRLLNDLVDIQKVAGFGEKIDINLVRSYLADRLEHEELGTGFFTGGVTFCTMLPMRSIPFRVVALVGMNDTAFPRIDKPMGFDLMVKSARASDPSRRDEDRYLFLEALLCAREHFLISYVGQSIKDNSQIPPSVVVSELLEVIEQGFKCPPKSILDHLITYHRLQAFSPAYFQPDGPLFSYSAQNFQALRSKQKASPFISEPLPELPEERKVLSLNDLIRFLVNPTRFFLLHRLGIRLEELFAPVEEREPFEIDGLEKYRIEQELMNLENLEERYPLVRARGVLPPGTMGKMSYNEICARVNGFMARVLKQAEGEKLAPLEVNLDLGGFRLTGRLDNIWSSGLLRYRCARIKAGDFLGIWIEHLAINCMKQPGYPTVSTIIGLDGPKIVEWRFNPVPDSHNILEQILKLYWRGMCLPLSFFPETSLDYTKRGGDTQEALKKARACWQGSPYSQGEREDPYLQLCFSKIDDPLDESFQILSRDIFEPLLRYRQ